MLLIVTERGDYHADWVVLELEARGVPFLRFNTEDYPLSTSFHWSPAGRVELGIGHHKYDLNNVTAVWYRRPVPPVVAADLPATAAAWARAEAREALMGAWRTLDALWVNHPDRNRVAESKLLQLRTAMEIGFDVPESLVSNEREQVEAFVAAHSTGVVCKPLMNGRVPIGSDEQLFFTSRVNDQVSLAQLGAEPYLFQELVPKLYDIRVTVIGEEVFAVRIDSQQAEDTVVDWRRGRPGMLDHTPIELGAGLASHCVSLCRRFGLQFGAIDLACQPDGRHIFFEINPNGQWAWVEQRTRLPLRARMVDLLLSADDSDG